MRVIYKDNDTNIGKKNGTLFDYAHFIYFEFIALFSAVYLLINQFMGIRSLIIIFKSLKYFRRYTQSIKFI